MGDSEVETDTTKKSKPKKDWMEDFLSFNDEASAMQNVKDLHIRNKTLVEKRDRNSKTHFFDDCENCLVYLTNYNHFKNTTTNQNLGKNLVFILGFPRSGKTTLEEFLSHCPNTHSLGENNTILKMFRKLEGPDGNDYRYPSYLPKMKDSIFPDMANDFFEKYLDKVPDKKAYILNSLPGNFLYVPLLKKMLPDCKIIWCHRQRQRQLVSLYAKMFPYTYWDFTDDVDELLEAYDLYYQVYDLYKSKMPDGFLDIQFEDTLNNPEKTLRTVLDYIGEDYSESDVAKAMAKNKDHIANIRYIDDNIKKYLVYLPEFL